jgi:hypothetical protein
MHIDQTGSVLAGYVVYPLAETALSRFRRGLVMSARQLNDWDYTTESPAGWYLSAIAAAGPNSRAIVIDLARHLTSTGRIPVVARAATSKGARLLRANGSTPINSIDGPWMAPAWHWSGPR